LGEVPRAFATLGIFDQGSRVQVAWDEGSRDPRFRPQLMGEPRVSGQIHSGNIHSGYTVGRCFGGAVVRDWRVRASHPPSDPELELPTMSSRVFQRARLLPVLSPSRRGSSRWSASTLLALSLIFPLIAGPVASCQAQDAEWISLFDGKSLEGWEKVGNEASVWEVQEGEIRGSGAASMLVSTQGPYKNFRYRAELKINDRGNSGLYFRTTRKPGFSDGYEAQVDSTHTDPIRTGSLYGFCHVYKRLVEPDTWFTYDIEVRDDVWRGREMTRIKITVDGNELYEYLDFDKTYKSGHFAFQQHDPGSKVSIRKVEVLPLKD
jgi:hypothetical protein